MHIKIVISLIFQSYDFLLNENSVDVNFCLKKVLNVVIVQTIHGVSNEKRKIALFQMVDFGQQFSPFRGFSTKGQLISKQNCRVTARQFRFEIY